MTVSALGRARPTPTGARRGTSRPLRTHDRTAFTALNTAFFSDGAFVRVPRGHAAAEPIHLSSSAHPRTTVPADHPRVLVLVEEGAQATVVESVRGVASERYFTNAVTELVAGRRRESAHYKMLRESDRAFHIGTTEVTRRADSNFSSARDHHRRRASSRNELNVVARRRGPSCDAERPLPDRRRAAVRQPHGDRARASALARAARSTRGSWTAGREASSTARSSFARIAQKTDAQQTNRNLLLSADGHDRHEATARDLRRRREVHARRER